MRRSSKFTFPGLLLLSVLDVANSYVVSSAKALDQFKVGKF